MLKIITKKRYEIMLVDISTLAKENARLEKECEEFKKANLGLKEMLAEEAKKVGDLVQELSALKETRKKENARKANDAQNATKKWLKGEYGVSYGK